MSGKLNTYIVWFNDGSTGYRDVFDHTYNLDDFLRVISNEMFIISKSRIAYATKYISTVRKIDG